jgi:inosine-uridine nucleoside N-ribohydrolase
MNRLFCGSWGVFLIILAGISFATSSARAARPVILDTDICDDIDDTWALALLLKSPELDCRLVVTAVGDTQAKAKIVAKFLEKAGRTDIPVGVGVKQGDGPHRQMGWVKDYDLASYPGKVHKDGVQAMIDAIMNSPSRVTLIALGPLPNVAEALKREPRIAEKADFVGMHGSVFVGYGGKDTPDAEYNVVKDVDAAKKTFTAAWPMTITPLDTCGLVEVDGPNYQSLLKSDSAIVRSLLENYRLWYLDGLKDRKDLDEAARIRMTDEKLRHSSTTLFDTVAVYLAVNRDLVEMKQVPLCITADGFTRVEAGAKAVDCAVKWKDLDGYESWLVERLTK